MSAMLGCVRPYVGAPVAMPSATVVGSQAWSVRAGWAGLMAQGSYASGRRWVLSANASAAPRSVGAHHDLGGQVDYFLRVSERPDGFQSDLRLAAGGAVGLGQAPAPHALRTFVGVGATWGWQHASFAMAIRSTAVALDHHRATAHFPRYAQALMIEPVAVLKAGSRRLCAELQLGVSAPVWRRHDLGAQWPLVASLGVLYVP